MERSIKPRAVFCYRIVVITYDYSSPVTELPLLGVPYPDEPEAASTFSPKAVWVSGAIAA